MYVPRAVPSTAVNLIQYLFAVANNLQILFSTETTGVFGKQPNGCRVSTADLSFRAVVPPIARLMLRLFFPSPFYYL